MGGSDGRIKGREKVAAGVVIGVGLGVARVLTCTSMCLNMGRRKARVFPEPVLATAMRSRPHMIAGMARKRKGVREREGEGGGRGMARERKKRRRGNGQIRRAYYLVVGWQRER